MEYITIIVMAGWTLLNLVFAWIDPPPALSWLMPRKVWALFFFLPEPWNRRIGMTFNGVAGIFVCYLLVRYMVFV